jgi:hypothetical protein
MGYNKL